MIGYLFVAFFNGVVVGTSRATNGRLSSAVGPFKASLWNHVVGFLLLTVIIFLASDWHFAASPPWPAYLGGVFGALFVAVNSYVFPRLGAMNAALLAISGQMITAVLVDFLNQGVTPTVVRCLGVVIVLLGVYLSRVTNARRDKAEKDAGR